MSKNYTIAQGDTLTRIARQHGFLSGQSLYDHPDNAEFRALRPDPNILAPGDVITIPELEPRKFSANSASKHTFCVKKEKEFFRMQLKDEVGEPLSGMRAVLDVGGQSLDAEVGSDGMLELELPEDTDLSTSSLKVFLDPYSEEPSHEFDIQVAHMDPVEELSGIQARCNMLGYYCGVVDGLMGDNTREGVKSFQMENGLNVDGKPGPLTQAKLKEVFGY